ncbi:hypothetical protein FB567DRAFT_528228 [Paraphoma chrysanthemicola]|uniref:Uncharacterized protein n=1 Tax=Paraphoma chrysanthemicola TaxID=798071 RepID=A0A8K0VYM3_9PLEO|nr:hypothetical protein FB567DRAFT_528228 [Paraphoma chrysanthemicola]
MGTNSSQPTQELLPATTQADGTPGHFRFLDLPAEIRLYVYEEVVVVGKVFFTPDQYEVCESRRFLKWREYGAPSLSILRVCKQTHHEATPIYLGKNLFVLPRNFDDQQPFNKKGYVSASNLRVPGRHLFPQAGLSSIKRLSIDFTSRSRRTLVMYAPSWARLAIRHGVHFDQMTAAHRTQYAHATALVFLKHHWSCQTEVLKKVTSTRDYLELDFTNAFCPEGCCRCLTIDFEFLSTMTPKKVTTKGLRVGEKDMLAEAMTLGMKSGNANGEWVEILFEDG